MKPGDMFQRVEGGVVYIVKEVRPGNPFQSKPKIVARSTRSGIRFHPGDRRLLKVELAA